jgi:uncharacterized protein DUF6900
MSLARKGKIDMSATETALEVAQKKLGLNTLETQDSDRLDFHELSVWQLKEALEAAYEAGAKQAAN